MVGYARGAVESRTHRFRARWNQFPFRPVVFEAILFSRHPEECNKNRLVENIKDELPKKAINENESWTKRKISKKAFGKERKIKRDVEGKKSLE